MYVLLCVEPVEYGACKHLQGRFYSPTNDHSLDLPPTPALLWWCRRCVSTHCRCTHELARLCFFSDSLGPWVNMSTSSLTLASSQKERWKVLKIHDILYIYIYTLLSTPWNIEASTYKNDAFLAQGKTKPGLWWDLEGRHAYIHGSCRWCSISAFCSRLPRRLVRKRSFLSAWNEVDRCGHVRSASFVGSRSDPKWSKWSTKRSSCRSRP